MNELCAVGALDRESVLELELISSLKFDVLCVVKVRENKSLLILSILLTMLGDEFGWILSCILVEVLETVMMLERMLELGFVIRPGTLLVVILVVDCETLAVPRGAVVLDKMLATKRLDVVETMLDLSISKVSKNLLHKFQCISIEMEKLL